MILIKNTYTCIWHTVLKTTRKDKIWGFLLNYDTLIWSNVFYFSFFSFFLKKGFSSGILYYLVTCVSKYIQVSSFYMACYYPLLYNTKKKRRKRIKCNFGLMLNQHHSNNEQISLSLSADVHFISWSWSYIACVSVYTMNFVQKRTKIINWIGDKEVSGYCHAAVDLFGDNIDCVCNRHVWWEVRVVKYFALFSSIFQLV